MNSWITNSMNLWSRIVCFSADVAVSQFNHTVIVFCDCHFASYDATECNVAKAMKSWKYQFRWAGGIGGHLFQPFYGASEGVSLSIALGHIRFRPSTNLFNNFLGSSNIPQAVCFVCLNSWLVCSAPWERNHLLVVAEAELALHAPCLIKRVQDKHHLKLWLLSRTD